MKERVYLHLLEVLEANDGYCMDVPEERKKLAKALEKMLEKRFDIKAKGE